MKVNARVPGTEVGSAKALPPGGVRPALGSGARGAGVGGRGHRPAGPPQEVAGKTQAAPSTAGRSDSTDRKKFKKLGRKLTPEAVDSIRALKT